MSKPAEGWPSTNMNPIRISIAQPRNNNFTDSGEAAVSTGIRLGGGKPVFASREAPTNDHHVQQRDSNFASSLYSQHGGDRNIDVFNEKNLESYISASNPLLFDVDQWDETKVEVIRFKFNGSAIFLDMTPEEITLEELHAQVLHNSRAIEDGGRLKEQDKIRTIKERIAQKKKEKGGEVQTTEGVYFACLECNTYPLDVRYRATDRVVLDEIERRLDVKITTEGRRLNDSFLFVNFEGKDEDNVGVACQELRFLMDNEVVDEAKETELRDLMRMVLSVGDVTRPSINVRRHCVLVGLYPVQCIIMADEMILVESKGLSLTDNQVLEKTAVQMKMAMQSWMRVEDASVHTEIPTGAKCEHRKTEYEDIATAGAEYRRGTPQQQPYGDELNSISKRKTFDQVCLHSVFVTVCGLVKNAADSLQTEAKKLCEIFNTKSFVSLSDQRAMQMLKAQGERLIETVGSHARSLENLIDNDIQMAFMNLDTMRNNVFMYRMTVNNKMTLSQSDKRVAAASHDIELLLYAYLLRYAKMENEMKTQKNIIVSTEQGQELQGLNVQTKVLVANTAITVFATAIGFCGYVVGAFGMNLNNDIVAWPEYTFSAVCIATFAFILISTKICMILLRRSGVLPSTKAFTFRDHSKDSLFDDGLKSEDGVIDTMLKTLHLWSNKDEDESVRRSS